MPRISEFFGIVIYMYWFDEKQHKIPHIHARYSGQEAVFDLEGIKISGEIGNRAERLVSEWCQERRFELRRAWICAINGSELPWITPIK